MKDNPSALAALWVALTLPLMLVDGSTAGAPSLRALPFDAKDVSADGRVVVGQGGAPEFSAIRWTAAEGAVPVGPRYSSATAVSADGAVIVGQISGMYTRPFYWNAPSGYVAVEVPSYGEFIDVSGDGETVVGTDFNSGKTFRWNRRDGLMPIEAATWDGIHVGGISYDGSVIVGSAWRGDPTEAVRWSRESGAVLSLGVLPAHSAERGMIYSGAAAVSADGRVIVGTSQQMDFDNSYSFLAFQWTTAAGLVPLTDHYSIALDVSGDGSAVVGGHPAFIWDEAHGVRNLHDVLSELGLDIIGWRLNEAVAISADGLTIIGNGIDPSGREVSWVATIPEPCAATLIALAAVSIGRRRSSLAGPRRP